ncbi:MAG: SDR family NAD(P)-dependent oxidoreductase [Acidimicrobiales bacterium]
MTATAIVTGGSRGLGRALAGSLAASGWYVLIDGRTTSEVREAAETVGAHALPGDVTQPLHRRRLVEAAGAATGRLDLLVNNASTLGASPLPRLRDLPMDIAERVYAVNALAPLALIQEAMALLTASGGAVLNITSDAAVEAYEGWGGYGSSKAALDQLSHVLAGEEPDLAVWWLDPGDMRTRMHQEAYPGEDISDRPEPETVVPAIRALLDRRPPSGRVRAGDLVDRAGP